MQVCLFQLKNILNEFFQNIVICRKGESLFSNGAKDSGLAISTKEESKGKKEGRRTKWFPLHQKQFQMDQ